MSAVKILVRVFATLAVACPILATYNTDAAIAAAAMGCVAIVCAGIAHAA